MPDKAIVTFADSSIQDLEDILKYYQEQGLLHIGERLVNRVFGDIELLASQPDIGRIVPEQSPFQFE